MVVGLGTTLRPGIARPLVDTTDVVSIDSLAPDDATDVVSIESLTYTEPAGPEPPDTTPGA